MREDIGWIGLGAMGGAIAQRIVTSGLSLQVFDKLSSAVARLESVGAVGVNDLSELRRCSIVFACLPHREASEAVALDVLASKASRPDIYVECSTLAPFVVRDLADRAASCGASFLDAPVSGDARSKESRPLSVMVGGDGNVVARVRPIFETFARSVFHLGPVGSGSVAKISNNLISLTSLVTVMEGLLLGVRQGLRIDQLSDAIMASSGAMPAVRRIAGQYVSREYRSWGAKRATMSIVIKDLRAAIALAEESGLPVRTAEAALDSWLEGAESGKDDRDIYALLDYLENWRCAASV
jgi:3-hydroxyisobutyrate dehydrogenase-like beta-hydroxyacid dehydrogenase